MRATVWTSWNVKADPPETWKPKCVFEGDISSVPKVDEYVVVIDGFAAMKVKSVIHDFTDGSIEIQTYTVDVDNEYGESLI